jgi:RNA polymerase sigma-70 factor, ECF subfamily
MICETVADVGDACADARGAVLDRAVAGDAAALRELLMLHGGRARAAVVPRIDRRWRAVLDEDDVMQVAYMEAFLHIHQLTARDERSFVAWLTRIAENALRDAVRGLTRDKRPDPARRVHAHTVTGGGPSHVVLLELLGVTTSTPSRAAMAQEAAGSLEAAVGQLPPDYATVVRLYDLRGLSPAEVAGRMGRSVGAVHMLRARAHERLREEMGCGSRFFSRWG